MLTDFEALEVLGEFKAKPKSKKPAPRKQKTLAAARKAHGIPMRSEEIVGAEIVKPQHEKEHWAITAIYVALVIFVGGILSLIALFEFFRTY